MSRKRPNFDATNPASYPGASWAIYDTVVRDATTLGMGVDLTVGEPVPLWATGAGAPPGAPHYQWRPSAGEFGQFMRAVGKRYSGSYKPAGASTPLPRVRFWAVWNEPNYGVYLAPQAIDHSTVEVSPLLYRGLVDAAWSALHATGHGHDTILIGETAPRGVTTGNNPGNFSGMVPLRFIRALYCVDSNLKPLQGQAAAQRGCPTTATASKQFASQNPGLFHATGFADHPYPQGKIAPNVPTTDEPDYADLPALPKLERTLDGSSRPTAPTRNSRSTPPSSACRPTRRRRSHARSTQRPPPTTSTGRSTSPGRDPRIASSDQYLLSDPPGGNFATGLEYANLKPKPYLYDAYRMPLYLPVTRAHEGQRSRCGAPCARARSRARPG